MSYLFSDHQRALAPLLFPNTEFGSRASRQAAVLPRFDAPPMENPGEPGGPAPWGRGPEDERRAGHGPWG